mmetsp:Transcript_33457/g.77730  ORF Transcript_33457/g.77730 Transcript_33457/m.77730 type:complete len:204 (-) Transcript_33457:90-701(-)|eukprot:CAMPEP_0171104392 /NCGR_PEP_ID=MMETSP0766_2-20121228/60539_1 /TAXON_ID=439317 /ORGANISM="Gambierdiscus australes, Strain CAWD 149" /LENGTH=203 /DNA_ID=CAMNT_0011565011 /DNA_START=39 /DNA_END=650 /DNA_ORIENTATION=+
MAFSEAELQSRLAQEKVKDGVMSASLVWDGPAGLQIHALIHAPGFAVKTLMLTCSPCTHEISLFNPKGISSSSYPKADPGCGGYMAAKGNGGLYGKVQPVAKPLQHIVWTDPIPGKYVIKIKYFCPNGPDAKFTCFLNKDGKLTKKSGRLTWTSTMKAFEFTVEKGARAAAAPKVEAKAKAKGKAKEKAKAKAKGGVKRTISK